MAEWLECQTRDQKGPRFQILAEAVGEVSSQGSAFCADSYFSIHSTSVTAAACERSWSLC